MPDATLRPATRADAERVARIWREGWRDGHLGHVPAALVEVRTPESFAQRAADRVADTTVAVVDGADSAFVALTLRDLRGHLVRACATLYACNELRGEAGDRRQQSHWQRGNIDFATVLLDRGDDSERHFVG